jgi:hypothetical protein
VLLLVDPNILESYLHQLLSSIPSLLSHSLARCEHYASKGLEISGVLDKEGSMYSSRVIEIMEAVQTVSEGKKKVVHRDDIHLQAAKEAGWGDGAKAVLEGSVEVVLDRLRLGQHDHA